MLGERPVVRVGFALGSWQVVALAAGLAEADARAPAGRLCDDHLVLYETVVVSDALQAAMREVGAAIRPWRRIVDAFALMASVQRRIGQAELDALKARLRAHLGLERIDELWLCWLTRPPEKLVLETYPEAAVHLFEDGLFSYLPERPTPDRPGPLGRWLDARRPVRRFRRYKSWLDPQHAERIAAAWMLLGDRWPAPAVHARVPWHTVGAGVLRATLAGCRTMPSVAGFAPVATPRPAFLVLGQVLSRWQAMSREAELGVYAGAVAAAVERGYDVWWKEHPRAQAPFFAALAATAPAGRLRELALPFALPVELVADRLGLAGCAAGISTAIFYLPRLCGTPCYTFADALAPHLQQRWALQNELVRRAAAPLSALPAATAPAALPPAPAMTTSPGEAAARIYIGTDPSQAIACTLLQHSMRRHTTLPLVFDTMQSVRWPMPVDPRHQPRTEFSFHRFAIPKLAGFHGRALYVDADMLVFRDLHELWDLPFGDATVLHAPSSDPKRPKQFSVMLLDCDRLRWQPEDIVAGLDAGRYDYEQLVGQVCLEPPERVQARLPVEWNSLDRHEPGRTGLLHYTHIETQPWVYARHPHGDLWVAELQDAIDAGVVGAAEVDDAVRRGWARPSLPRQLRTRRALWPAFGRLVAPLLDRGFEPHRDLRERLGRLRSR